VASNDFLPAERSLSECLSVLPKPGCGSEARGGWAQTAVFLALIGGLGVIGTRIVIGIRRRDERSITPISLPQSKSPHSRSEQNATVPEINACGSFPGHKVTAVAQ
jgi:hypothetical protein